MGAGWWRGNRRLRFRLQPHRALDFEILKLLKVLKLKVLEPFRRITYWLGGNRIRPSNHMEMIFAFYSL
jgi:hypothetical protein